MGFDTSTISNILLQDLPFQPYFFSVDKLRIWAMSIGRKSNKNEWNFAGIGYKAFFIYTYQKRCVFVQEFEEEEYSLKIYTGANILQYYFIECNPESL